MTVTAHNLAAAISWASTLHSKQLDRGGNPYILHPLYVMNEVSREQFDSEEDKFRAMIVAVCHDTIEDCFENKANGFIQFSEIVTNDQATVKALRLVTHSSDDSYEDMIVMISTNKIARLVKIHDLRHNTQLTRLKGITDKDVLRMKKYMRAYAYLTGGSDLIYKAG